MKASRSHILEQVSSPADLKGRTNAELAFLAEEIRQEIIQVTSETGGHVASSLGAVEIILAAHSVLDCPQDKIVFDVGHQAYAHKLVTGRFDEFKSLRSLQGVSGFPRPCESPYDVHHSGHASDSLSVALGLAKARSLSGDTNKIMVVIGDGALAGGMAFEALNHIGQAQIPMIIVLNDNEMSISRNVGALTKYLNGIRTSSQYAQLRENTRKRLESGGSLGKSLASLGRGMRESMKQFILPHGMLFEHLGILSTVPIDGHDVGMLRTVFGIFKDYNGPALIHVITKKGKGYKPAELDPERFHGVGPFCIETGLPKSAPSAVPSFTEVFGSSLVREAREDEDIVAITAAMRSGTGLKPFAAEFPERFVDTGIAEEHAVAMAGGLASAGKKPVVAIYSTFLQRAIDQIIIDVALPNLGVVFAVDRAGLVGEDGSTHHGAFDIVYLKMIPNLKILAPSDEAELASALRTALQLDCPVAIRYPRGKAFGATVPEEPELLEEGKACILREGDDVAILAFGSLTYAAFEAAEELAREGIEVRVADMRWVKPFDEQELLRAAQTSLVVTLESGAVSGGIGQELAACLAQKGSSTPVINLGYPDSFVSHGKPAELNEMLGLDSKGIAESIRRALAERTASES